MIISMSDILCVTNRTLCKEDFLKRVEKIAANHPKGIILREKDLSEKEYKELAEKVLMLCKTYEVPCMLHSFVDAAMELGAENIHLPLHILKEMDEKKKEIFVFRPSKDLQIKRVEKDTTKLEAMYNLGLKDFNDNLKVFVSEVKEA